MQHLADSAHDAAPPPATARGDPRGAAHAPNVQPPGPALSRREAGPPAGPPAPKEQPAPGWRSNPSANARVPGRHPCRPCRAGRSKPRDVRAQARGRGCSPAAPETGALKGWLAHFRCPPPLHTDAAAAYEPPAVAPGGPPPHLRHSVRAFRRGTRPGSPPALQLGGGRRSTPSTGAPGALRRFETARLETDFACKRRGGGS